MIRPAPVEPPPPDRQNAALQEALPFLHVAERDYTTVEMYAERLDVVYTLSVVYHNLALGFQALAAGESSATTTMSRQAEDARQATENDREMVKERDRMAETYLEIDKMRKEICRMEVDKELATLWDLVVKASAVLGR